MRTLVVLGSIAAFVLLSVFAADKPTTPDFSSYPQTKYFISSVSAQTNAMRHLQRSNLVAISTFPSKDREVVRYSVTEFGQHGTQHIIYDWAARAGNAKQLSEAELKNLRSAIRELPGESATPPIARLVIVSFRDGTNWVTRSYDRDALPKPMRQIGGIVGEQFELK